MTKSEERGLKRRVKMAALLREIKDKTGWTHEAIALELDVGMKQINYWMNQKVTPKAQSVEDVERLHRRLHQEVA